MILPNTAQDVTSMNKRVEAYGETERYWRLNRLEALWAGHAYEGMPSFWDRSVPLRQRAPAIQSSVVKTAGKRLASMVCGHRTFPAVKVDPKGHGVGLDDAQVEVLTRLVADLVERSRLRSMMLAVVQEGLKTGTVCVITSLIEGVPVVQIEPAKHCMPTLSPLGEVSHLSITYKVPSGPDQLSWYHREIGEGFDRVWPRVKCTDDGEPDWRTIEPLQTVEVGFVPVVWVRNEFDGVQDHEGIDGHPLAEGIEDEVAALDLSLSQLYRSGLYNGDPQLVQTGIESETPRPIQGERGPRDFESTWSKLMPSWAKPLMSDQGGALKKAPGNIWQLPPGGDAKMLESTGAGAQIIKTSVDEIRRIVVDHMGIVLADPDSLGRGDLSAKALTLIFGPMLDTASSLRVTYGEALVEIISQLMRHCLLAKGRGVVRLASWADALPVLALLQTSHGWMGAPLSLKWGDFFEPSWADMSTAVDVAQKATGGGPVMSRRKAVELLAKVLGGADDIESEMAAIDIEETVGRDSARDALAALGGTPGVGGGV